MKCKITFIELRKIQRLGSFLHLGDLMPQLFQIGWLSVLFGPLDRNRFEFNPQSEDVSHVGCGKLGYSCSFVRSTLNETLMLQFDQCLANKWDSSAKLLGDFAFNDGC